MGWILVNFGTKIGQEKKEKLTISVIEVFPRFFAPLKGKVTELFLHFSQVKLFVGNSCSKAVSESLCNL